MTASRIVTPALLSRADEQARLHGEPVLVALLRLAGAAPEAVMADLAAHTGMAWLDHAAMAALAPDFAGLTFAECLQRDCLLGIGEDGERVFIGSNPLDDALYTWASYRLRGRFRLAFAHPLELRALFARLDSHHQALSQLVRIEDAATPLAAAEEISLNSIAQDESQVVRLVNSTLYDAHRAGASDIHFENAQEGLGIRYRIDGVLGAARQLADAVMTEQVISRLKVMAELDIGERRIPQDGRFSVAIGGREIDFRVSIMPGLFGEDAVLRILDRQALATDFSRLTLSSLGFDDDSRDTIRRLANQPHGMLLVTGPTGSGKTTSLYATLSEINHGEDKIVTIEDPVEYQLPGVLQIPVNEKKGLTFARGLRSILRHDPDRILVGEIRDRETAEIAVQAALTGHLVYTTVHANNVFDVLGRFRHMGIDPYSLVTALNGVVAQRLIRLLCRHCAAPEVPDMALLQASGLTPEAAVGHDFRAARGCSHCRGTGYQGRRALAEVLVLDDHLRELILQQASLRALKEAARIRGMRSMREQALRAVQRGESTLQEINRVTFVD